MKNILIIICIFIFNVANSQNVIKVACVGNSITYGSSIKNPEKNSYPSQLQYYLGDKYKVANFGYGGATLLSKGNNPYIEKDVYKQSLEFNPDIVIIKLGTNDTQEVNRQYIDSDFESDYLSLIKSYTDLPSKPRVIIATPIRNYNFGDLSATNVVTQKIIPIIRNIAYNTGCEIIDLFTEFTPEKNDAEMADDWHPTSLGAANIARRAYTQIITAKNKSDFTSKIENICDEEFNFYGYKGYKYKVGEAECMVVVPKKCADGNPWVLRARFWGHEPQLDIALLEKGFHIAYCDVADLYGSKKATDRWDLFYKFMTKNGLNKKVALEGMSRGGLIIYNWAAQNSEKVAAIYGDNPVMDIKSWPMGEGKYVGSDIDIKQMMKAYGFSSKAEALAWRGNPIDHAQVLAKHNIPIIHVIGDADVIVPMDENSSIFEERFRRYGGKMTVIHKPGAGHHPHSLSTPRILSDFIMKSYDLQPKYYILATPGAEFREGAGWTKESEWHSISDDINNSLDGKQLDVLLIGNSITQGFGGQRKLVTYKAGKEYMDEIFGEDKWATAGISGDRTQNVLWRINNCNYKKSNPKYVFISIGINNFGFDGAKEITDGIVACAVAAGKEFKDSKKIFIFGLLPAGLEPDGETRKKCDEILNSLAAGNKELKKIPNLVFVDPRPLFTDENNNLKQSLYAGDYLHLSAEGYKEWSKFIKECIENK